MSVQTIIKFQHLYSCKDSIKLRVFLFVQLCVSEKNKDIFVGKPKVSWFPSFREAA